VSITKNARHYKFGAEKNVVLIRVSEAQFVKSAELRKKGTRVIFVEMV